jgi:hypothetical protein
MKNKTHGLKLDAHESGLSFGIYFERVSKVNDSILIFEPAPKVEKIYFLIEKIMNKK